jgi:gas vesicle protein
MGHKHSEQTAMSVMGVSLIMGGLGLLAGLLFAPKSGKETRVMLAQKGNRIKDSIKENTNDLHDKALEAKDNVAESVSDAVSNVGNKARETVDQQSKMAEEAASDMERSVKVSGRQRNST